MKRISLLLIGVLHVLTLNRVAAQQISIVPAPALVTYNKGQYVLPKVITIQVNNLSDSVRNVANQLGEKLKRSTGRSYVVKSTMAYQPGSIRLLINKAPTATLGTEGYHLSVTSNGVTITSNKSAGLFYGFQTLMQLFPKEIESTTAKANVTWKVPAASITDYPRFKWRGMMFDVARHFFTKQQVKQFIDNMVKYKFNVLHLHLTDDQGWRLQIKSLPKLTEVGAWRAERTGRWGEFSKPTPDEPKTYGGFYTQDDMREIIKYAADRYVNILPEIDIPGHSLAAVASYPELTCTPGTYQVNAGERFMIWKGGTFYGLLDNTICPANENVYPFFDKVFTEVAALFPFPYIHVGGDECYKGFWEKSDACKQLMQRENLKNTDELQSYFIKRIEKIVSAKGKKVMGWDEILQGGLAPGAAVMSWRGMQGGVEAAKMNHEVVMTPNTFAYLDLYQGDPMAEPPTYSMVRLRKAYEFDPLPAGVDPRFILGGQCNLWSERLSTMRHAEYMLWPRAFAISESVWSLPAKKNWNNFVTRIEQQFERLDAAETKYSLSMYDPSFTVSKDTSNNIKISLSTEVSGLDIFYSFDETNPDRFYPKYQLPLTVPKDAANLKVITYRNNKPIGKLINMPIAELRKRAGIAEVKPTPTL
ncbi:family 20 glycosylhydrolase [Mucilaginibacter sp. PAMB04274]|uniref:beta-N-acetylhexosaminidase n=1 Tax=Mucilaginibacter sp. PAMB04274 TaxID=3138568 RepID=UPI0031F66B7F